MILSHYAHHQGDKVVSARCARDVHTALSEIRSVDALSGSAFRLNFLRRLSQVGWSNRVRVDSVSRISITSALDETGLCVQTGNMGRFYADLLKLELLHSREVLASAIYVIPTKRFSKKIGSNVANFERLVDELGIFSPVIRIPILVFGFGEA